MTPTEAKTAVRASTLHDSDTQVTDAQLDTRLDLEYKRLYRELVMTAPSLFETTAAPVIAAGASTFNKEADFERLVRLERLISGTNYYPVRILGPDALNVNQGGSKYDLVAYERGNTFVVRPDTDAPGTYRITYIKQPVAGYSSYDVPGGCELIIVERVAAWVRQRHKEDPSYHLRAADQIWKEQRSAVMRRYGRHPVPGLARVRGW